MGLIDRLVTLLRPEPGASVTCLICRRVVPRREAVGGCCGLDHFHEWQNRNAY